jgi:sodium-independent sulfate anion transporter 11
LEGGGDDIELVSSGSVTDRTTDNIRSAFPNKVASLQGVNRPFFHLDLAAAVETAVANAEATSKPTPNALKTE